jgi:hypothetical protein
MLYHLDLLLYFNTDTKQIRISSFIKTTYIYTKSPLQNGENARFFLIIKRIKFYDIIKQSFSIL